MVGLKWMRGSNYGECCIKDGLQLQRNFYFRGERETKQAEKRYAILLRT